MQISFWSWLKARLQSFGQKGTVNLENIGFALTATAIVGAVVVVTGNTVVLDTEEKIHVLNAQSMAAAVEMMIGEKNNGPALNSNATFTLKELYAADRISPAKDASKDDGSLYNGDDTKVLVQNIPDTSSPSANRTVNKIFVKLVAANGYVYTDQTDTTIAVANRVEAANLSRDNILIPRRNTDGF